MLDYEIFNPYEGLIFDMDGTLIDTMPMHAEAWTMVGRNLAMNLIFKLCITSAGRRFRTIAGK